MSEYQPAQAEIYVPPPPNPVERIVTALRTGDNQALAEANVYYIDAVLPEAQSRAGTAAVYTEFHSVGNACIIVPSVENSTTHWAHKDGYHSMFDSKPSGELTVQAQLLESELDNTLQLTTETLLAKGTTRLVPGGLYQIDISALCNQGGQDLSWIQKIAEHSADYPSTKFTYKPSRTTFEQPIQGELPLSVHTEIMPDRIRVPDEKSDMRAGVVTGVAAIELPHVIRTKGGEELRKEALLSLRSIEAASAYHEAIYDATSLKRPGMFTIKTGNLKQRISIHYVIDEANNRARAFITYNNPPDEEPRPELRMLVNTAVSRYFSKEMQDGAEMYINEHVDHADLTKREY